MSALMYGLCRHEGLAGRCGDGAVRAVVLAVAATVRWVVWQGLSWQMDREIDLEAWRTAKLPVPLR